MTYTIEIPAEVEQVLVAHAHANGVTVTKYLQDIVIREVSAAGASGTIPALPTTQHDAEMDALEELALELAAKYPCTEPLADGAVALAYEEREDPFTDQPT